MVSPLSHRLCRRLALCLALAAVLATLAPPLHANPLHGTAPTGPVLRLLDWIQGLLAGLGVGAAEEEDGLEGPVASFLPEGGCVDPEGVPTTCPKTVTSEMPFRHLQSDAEPRGQHRIR